jgi:hypothetical protein
MEHTIITADTPLFRIKMRDPKESRLFFVIVRKNDSPHQYDWRSLLENWDGRDNFLAWARYERMSEQKCFKDNEEERTVQTAIIDQQSDQRYEQDFLRLECWTAEEADVIEAHISTLGCQGERKRMPMPTHYGPIDVCGNVWQYRNLWKESSVPCRIQYLGFFGVDTALVPLPDDSFDVSMTLSPTGEVAIQPGEGLGNIGDRR